jgi:nucleoside-diphosphate-sugar epimerase|tara:strand:+ start:1086 stop:2102 length:1017 start_codon:yes stop_codon:yes gene_type:complete
MNYLVTGGSGYLGNELINTLKTPDNEIINVDILPSDNENSNNYNLDIRNKSEVEKIFKEKKIDVIIHNSALVPITKKKDFDKTNLESTKLMLFFFEKYKIKKFIFISSSAVFGVPDKCPILEISERQPVEAYGQSKMKSENLCFDKINQGKNITIIRPRTIIGLNRFGIFSILFDWLKNDLPIPVIKGGKNLYQFVDIRDLCNAIMLTSKSDYRGALNIGSSDVKKILEILQFLKNEFNSKSKIKSIENSIILKIGFLMQKMNLIPLHDYHFKVYGSDVYFDISLAKKILGWTPKYSTFESFKDSYNHYLLNYLSDRRKSIHQRIINNYILRYVSLFL